MSWVDSLREHLVQHFDAPPWTALPAEFAKLDLPWRERGEIGKARHLRAIFRELPDDHVVAAAREVFASLDKSRISLDMADALAWHDAGGVQRITEVTRLNIANAFDENAHSFSGATRPLSTFQEEVRSATCHGDFFSLDSFEYVDGKLHIERANPGSTFGSRRSIWVAAKHEEFFRSWGVYEWPDARFARLLETTVNPVWHQRLQQAALVTVIDTALRADGFALRVVGQTSGQPVFGVRSAQLGVQGRPKNIIFASSGPKPIFGLIDAVNNDIVTLDHEDSCLIYDHVIKEDVGLYWEDLVEWWGERDGGASRDEAARGLGTRLRQSLDAKYERPFFDAYFTTMKAKFGNRLPALVPQVYLHYDPLTLKQRGGLAKFSVQRMDFLMLLPNRVRVVIELDGIQHHARHQSGQWHAAPDVYAETVAADRGLRLAGYEVYRFGGGEFSQATTSETVRGFFASLFRRHAITGG